MKTINQILLILCILILYSCNKDNDSVITEATSVTFNKPSFSLVVGGREKLLLITEPINATVSNTNWSSSDTSVAKVDSFGVVMAVAAGKTTITVTARNSISDECTVEVIGSPIAGLVMPEVNYPIAKDAIVMIQGTGFKSGDKIWLRKINISASTAKSAQTDGDILAKILEQTESYISFYCSITPGWYSVVLDENDIQFDLGNIEVEIPNIPAFTFDNTKIFWEDTHWRRFQLRGKVKEMTITEKYNNNRLLDNYKLIYKFNQLGHLECLVDEYNSNSTTYKYDDRNRLTNIYQYCGSNSHLTGEKFWETWEYTYGNHEMYFPIEFDKYSEGYWGNILSTEDGILWVKGLTGIRHENSYYNPTKVTIQQFEVNTGSIVVSTKFEKGDQKVIYTYDKAFPQKVDRWRTNFDESYNNGHDTETYQFSSTGMPIKHLSISDNGSVYAETIYVENAPFYLVSVSDGIDRTNEYDKDWNLFKHTAYKDRSYQWLINYTSYDKNGNWTGCNVKCERKNPIGVDVWSKTRDITYWE